MHATPVLTTPSPRFALDGEIARRLDAVTRQWILPAPYANPAMLEMFRRRDREPLPDCVPWAGEFAGKYLTHAVQIYRLSRDPALLEHLRWFVGELVSLQADNGYLGPWPEAYQLRRGCPSCETPWDAWGHYHIMIGLMLWHAETGDAAALEGCRRIGDLFCRRFLDGGESLHDAAAHEMNQAPAHSLALLHRLTGERRYLDMAQRIVDEFAKPPAGDYLNAPLAGRAFHETPKPRWESLHPIMALVELHYITGEPKHREAFERLWWSMLEGDRHNNGGFTSGEKATGNPYDTNPIETCCTVAWMTMSVEMLKLTGNPIVADELELSMLNSGVGMMSPSGRWVTYNTPMSGVREASAHTINFQCRAGQPELNCCSVNGPRAIGLLSEWAVMRQGDRITLNSYLPGSYTLETPGGEITLSVDGDYPVEPEAAIRVDSAMGASVDLLLRVPHWSSETRVTLDGEAVTGVEPGAYLPVSCRSGGEVRIAFDFAPQAWRWQGDDTSMRLRGDSVPHASIYRGPVLLAFDPRFNDIDLSQLPTLTPRAVRELRPIESESWLRPWMLLETHVDGAPVRLCDFASAGAGGEAYDTWLPMAPGGAEPAAFTATSPRRTRTV